MPVAKPVSSESRVIAHVDMDCFYVQVEQRQNPELRGKPAAVVQYNSWKGGGLIAVSYEARKYGVKRSMRGDEAKSICPEIQLVQVPVAREKADLNIYRAAGSEVVSILARKGRCERASIDEVYLDLTSAAEIMLSESPPEGLETIDDEPLKSHIVGLSQDGGDFKENVRNWLCSSEAGHNDKLLACGAIIVADLRAQVLRETEFTCSAGVAHNKMLAKLASGMNKPAQQTVVPSSSVAMLLGPLPVKKMKQLGGKLGDSLQNELGVKNIGDLLQFSQGYLQEHYGVNTGTWLWNIARGICGEEVEGRILPKSHASGKTFAGPRALRSIQSVKHWLNELCEGLYERLLGDLTENKRVARTLTLHARAYKINDTDTQKKYPSKSCPLRYGLPKLQEDACGLFRAGLRDFIGPYSSSTDKNLDGGWGMVGLSVSASNIVAVPPGTCSIAKFFKTSSSSSPTFPEKLQDKAIDGLSTPGMQTELSVESGDNELAEASAEESGLILNGLACENSVFDRESMSPNNQRGKGSILSFFHNQSQDCSSYHSPVHKSSSLLGAETGCYLVDNQSRVEEQVNNGPLHMSATSGLVQLEQLKKLKAKERGTILNFFRGSDSLDTHSKDQPATIDEDHAASTSGAEMDRQHGESWIINPADVDPTIVAELPLDIQEELRSWIRPYKRPHTTSNHSQSQNQSRSITRYFLPTGASK